MIRMKKTPTFYVNLIGLISLFFCTTGFLLAANPGFQATSVESCVECHEDFAKTYMAEPHAVIDAKGMAAALGVENSCATCHSKAADHMEEGGGVDNILAFSATDTPGEKTKSCLACHNDSNARFMASPHGKAAMDCTSCHVIHAENPNPSLLKTSTTKSCYVCHEDVFSEFQLNERHRLQEGIMSCTTCHNPHEPAVRERLAGFKHQKCLECHTDKGGPFLHEHGASHIEGCQACHTVHGSPNRHMLTHQSISDLCFSCHAAAPSWHSRFNSNTSNCTSCHATIHGSNLSKIFLK